MDPWDHKNETLKHGGSCLYHCCVQAWPFTVLEHRPIWTFCFSHLPPPSSHLACTPAPVAPLFQAWMIYHMVACGIWFPDDTMGRLVVRYRSSGGVTSLWVNSDQWEMGDRREPRSITWFGFIFGSCGQFILASHPGEEPHAKWICLLSNLPSLYMASKVIFSW